MPTHSLFWTRHETALSVVVLLLLVGVNLKSPGFAGPGNLVELLNDTSILVILGLGQMAVILTRGIDLSVAANLALTGMVVAMINSVAPGVPLAVLLVLAVAIGFALGAVNGLLVGKVGVPAIVVTLGTMAIYRGMIFLISGGEWINAHEMSDSFVGFPREKVLRLPILSWFAVLLLILMFVLIILTRLGRNFYAVGGSPHAAVYAGIDVGKTQFWAFSISGAFAGLCGYLWVSRFAVAYVDVARGFELEVIAACVIGGVSIAGGVGTVPGVVLGALFLGTVKNALPVIGISPFWQMAVAGSAILIAVIIHAHSQKTQGRIILKEARTVQ